VAREKKLKKSIFAATSKTKQKTSKQVASVEKHAGYLWSQAKIKIKPRK